MKPFLLNVSESPEGFFAAAFFQTQHDSFSEQRDGRTAAGGR
jgi:hypothetical protein